MVAVLLTLRSIVSALALLSLTLISRSLFNFILSRRNRAPYPPGPKPKWFIGNLYDFPTVNVPQEYLAWGKKHNSGIVHASSFGTHLVVVNKRSDIEELFEWRSGKYSDRPILPVVSLLGWQDWVFAFFPYGDYWRLHRKICKQNFSEVAVKQYHSIQIQKAREMLQGLLDTPEKFDYHCKMYSISVPLTTMYGYEPASIDDPVVAAAAKATATAATLLLPGASWVNVCPILKYVPIWFPGASTRKAAEEVKRLDEKVHAIPMEHLKQQMENGTAISSLVSNFFEKKATVGASEEEERATFNVAHTVYGAASDTTTSSTLTFVYLMAVNPEVQRKAQEEIDRVIGTNRLPDLNDRGSLPYVEAIYREVMRWKPPLPLGGPHRLIEDDYYNGYLIPKGSYVLPNLWAMTHDDEYYPEPFAFKPERFFDSNGALISDDAAISFGFGRRACPGKHLGSSTMWLFMVSILFCFKVDKSKDENGCEIDINDDYDDFGMVSHKKDFRCSITPRSPAVARLIEAE